MNIFVFLISYGLMIGVVTFAIPMTRRIGKMFLTASGILFLIACAMLLFRRNIYYATTIYNNRLYSVYYLFR